MLNPVKEKAENNFNFEWFDIIRASLIFVDFYRCVNTGESLTN